MALFRHFSCKIVGKTRENGPKKQENRGKTGGNWEKRGKPGGNGPKLVGKRGEMGKFGGKWGKTTLSEGENTGLCLAPHRMHTGEDDAWHASTPPGVTRPRQLVAKLSRGVTPPIFPALPKN